MNIVFIIILIAILALITYIYEIRKKLYIKENAISFKESVDLCKLPIVTFMIDGVKYNFLLDSGADDCVINKSLIPHIKCTKSNRKGYLNGVEGNQVLSEYYFIDLEYKNNKYLSEFVVVDLDNAANIIKQESGITIHGFLGTKFFVKFSYVLDFKDLIAYTKK